MIAQTDGVSYRGQLAFDVKDAKECGVFGSYAYFVAEKAVVFVDLTSSNDAYDFHVSLPIHCACALGSRALWLGCDASIVVFCPPLEKPSSETISVPSCRSIIQSLVPLRGAEVVASLDLEGCVTLWDSVHLRMLRNVCVMGLGLEPPYKMQSSDNFLVVRSQAGVMATYEMLGVESDGVALLAQFSVDMPPPPGGAFVVSGTNVWHAISSGGVAAHDVRTGLEKSRIALSGHVRSIVCAYEGTLWALYGSSIAVIEGMELVSQDEFSVNGTEGVLVPLYRAAMDVVWHLHLTPNEPICTVLSTERLLRYKSEVVSSSHERDGEKKSQTTTDAESQCSLVLHSDEDVTQLLREARRVTEAQDATIEALREDLRKHKEEGEDVPLMRQCLAASERQIHLLASANRDINDALQYSQLEIAKLKEKILLLEKGTRSTNQSVHRIPCGGSEDKVCPPAERELPLSAPNKLVKEKKDFAPLGGAEPNQECFFEFMKRLNLILLESYYFGKKTALKKTA